MTHSPDSLAALALAAAGGSRAAFEAIHTRLAPGLRRLLLDRGCDAATVDDLCQKTWTGTWEACAARRYDPRRSSIATFVYAVMNNVWVEHLRGKGRRDAFTALSEDVPVFGGSPGDAAPAAEALQRMRAALASTEFTEQERWTLRLVAEGASDRAIAQRLGVAPSTAHQTRQAALAKLRRILGRGSNSAQSGERPGTRPESPVEGLSP